MKRRSALAAIATTAVAGCLSRAAPDSNSDDQQRLKFGEWHERNDFAILVEGLEVLDRVTLADAGRETVHEFDPERLAIVDYSLEAIATEPDEYHPMYVDLAIVVDGDERELGVDETEFGGAEVCDDAGYCQPVGLSDAKSRDDRRRGHWSLPMEPGETRELWGAALVSGETTADELEVAVDDVRWS